MKILDPLVPGFVLALAANVAAYQKQLPLARHPAKGIPWLGFGTWNMEHSSNTTAAVSLAIQHGYRHIDAAAIYGNEKDVGAGIRDGLRAAGLERSDIWVTSKLWNDAHDADEVPKALRKTLKDLDLDYLDLYLMHWPVKASVDGTKSIEYLDTYRAMLNLPKSSVRHVGVCNFSPVQMKLLLLHFPALHERPYAHQFETHPYLPDADYVHWHAEHGIHVTAYSPLGNMNPIYSSDRKEGSGSRLWPLLKHPIVNEIAERIGCTPAQVVLSWGMERGTSVIPKTVHEDRMKENLKACELSHGDVLGMGRIGIHRFNNPAKSWDVMLYEGQQDGPGVTFTSVWEMNSLRLRFALDRWLKWYNEVWWDSEGSADLKSEI